MVLLVMVVIDAISTTVKYKTTIDCFVEKVKTNSAEETIYVLLRDALKTILKITSLNV